MKKHKILEWLVPPLRVVLPHVSLNFSSTSEVQHIKYLTEIVKS